MHMLGTLAGFEAAMRAVLDIASPGVDRRTRRRTERLPQIAVPTLCWTEYEKAHGELRMEIEERRDGPINRAFVAAYRRQIGAADESRSETGGHEELRQAERAFV